MLSQLENTTQQEENIQYQLKKARQVEQVKPLEKVVMNTERDTTETLETLEVVTKRTSRGLGEEKSLPSMRKKKLLA